VVARPYSANDAAGVRACYCNLHAGNQRAAIEYIAFQVIAIGMVADLVVSLMTDDVGATAISQTSLGNVDVHFEIGAKDGRSRARDLE
jgi:hypothetical protein